MHASIEELPDVFAKDSADVADIVVGLCRVLFDTGGLVDSTCFRSVATMFL